MDVITLREDYFCCNTYIAIEAGEAIIVDAGVSIDTISALLQKRGNPIVKGILLTHAHFDHILSLKEYIEYFGCDVFVYKKGISNLKNTINNYSQFTEKLIEIESPHIKSLPRLQKFKLGNFYVKYLYTPGHTDDSVCYVVDDVMFTGDTIFDGVIGRTDLANSDEGQMAKSLKLLYLEPEYQMYFTGHGRKSERENMRKYLELLNNKIEEL